MSDWSWKQAVGERILSLVNARSSPLFSIKDVYEYADELSSIFPKNKHVKEKIRQTLQRLRDSGFLEFRGEGEYGLNLAHDELQSDTAPLKMKGIYSPITKQVLRNVRFRSTFLAAEIKRRYRNVCQVCRTSIVLAPDRTYSEAHHLRPIGAPHYGPDVPSNIIVACPNHHVMFDRGAVTVLPDSLRIQHVEPSVFPKNSRLYLEPWHALNRKFVLYHHEKIFSQSLLLSNR